MSCPMMDGMTTGMMVAIGLLVVVVLILAAAALGKYLFFSARDGDRE